MTEPRLRQGLLLLELPLHLPTLGNVNYCMQLLPAMQHAGNEAPAALATKAGAPRDAWSEARPWRGVAPNPADAPGPFRCLSPRRLRAHEADPAMLLI